MPRAKYLRQRCCIRLIQFRLLDRIKIPEINRPVGLAVKASPRLMDSSHGSLQRLSVSSAHLALIAHQEWQAAQFWMPFHLSNQEAVLLVVVFEANLIDEIAKMA